MVFNYLYTNLFKPLAFRQDPEDVHDKMLAFGKTLGGFRLARSFTEKLFRFDHPALCRTILGIDFKNPIGLAAGFDKNAQLLNILPAVGFGFAEVGSITGEPCAGNAKPRLWRLPQSESILVHYGLYNDGCEAVSRRLGHQQFEFPFGTSVAKTNSPATVDTEAGIADYVKAYTAFADIGSYSTINISCPNAYGGQPFTDPKKLDMLLTAIDRVPSRKPIFIKLSPDIPREQLNEILEIIDNHVVHGIICSNLTKQRNNITIKEENVPKQGGFSGKVVEGLANELIRYVYQKTNGRYVIVGCGGVSSAEDAYTKIKLGASLIQMITGMIYKGPQIIGEINRGLVQLLADDGLHNISEAVGIDNF